MRPPSNRTAYGSDFKLEPLDDIQARADDFRRQLGNVKGEMLDAAMGNWDAQTRYDRVRRGRRQRAKDFKRKRSETKPNGTSLTALVT